MIDVLEEIALLEKIKDAASEQDYGKVIGYVLIRYMRM